MGLNWELTALALLNSWGLAAGGFGRLVRAAVYYGLAFFAC